MAASPSEGEVTKPPSMARSEPLMLLTRPDAMNATRSGTDWFERELRQEPAYPLDLEALRDRVEQTVLPTH